MNKSDNTSNIRKVYIAPLCETHTIVPEGMVCMSRGGAGEYDEEHINNLGGWF